MIRTANKDARDLIAVRREFRGSNLAGRAELFVGSTGRLEGRELERYCAAFREAIDAGARMYVVYSYATPVAWTRADGRAEWTVTETRYSVATARHLGIVRSALARAGARWAPPGWPELLAEAERLGERAGAEAAAWHTQHMTSPEAARLILDGIDAGDPAVLDTFPARLLDEEDTAPVMDAARRLELPDPDTARGSDPEEVWDAYRLGWARGVEHGHRRALRASDRPGRPARGELTGPVAARLA